MNVVLWASHFYGSAEEGSLEILYERASRGSNGGKRSTHGMRKVRMKGSNRPVPAIYLAAGAITAIKVHLTLRASPKSYPMANATQLPSFKA